jgi:hypothetical protein
MLDYELDAFEFSYDFGDSWYQSGLEPADWAVTGSAGVGYRFASNAEMTLDGYVRQVESGESPWFAIMAGVKMGF